MDNSPLPFRVFGRIGLVGRSIQKSKGGTKKIFGTDKGIDWDAGIKEKLRNADYSRLCDLVEEIKGTKNDIFKVYAGVLFSMVPILNLGQETVDHLVLIIEETTNTYARFRGNDYEFRTKPY